MPSICSRDIARAEWPNIRRFEHFLQLLNLVNDAFNVHSVSLSNMSVAAVKWSGIGLRDFSVTLRVRHFLDIVDSG